MSLFTAGIVLLLNIWGGKRSGLSLDPSKEMADVHKCMKMLRQLEPECVSPMPSLLIISGSHPSLQVAHRRPTMVRPNHSG